MDRSAQSGESGTKTTKAARQAAERAYLAALQRAIARQQRYPTSARRRQQTGVATVAFVLQADGRIGGIRIAKGSGHGSLDQASLDALRRLGRFKPIPPEVGRTSWPLRVPIRFDLR
ncbi:energy transducer TonB [Imhoffiella purpurea]|uniref:Ferric siderophore transport system, periplasmic binding protein TonB n=1 Tax=Imhoffiella purpurea TaxID=1249627 RepID=W9VJG9_9GAMM|nr:energy transducer TonB [Imhoffiella purpurea]EXJ16207.1 Ferric siderophore transport system, periplasmic binding protein TonB [Imhoffiella purpurea]